MTQFQNFVPTLDMGHATFIGLCEVGGKCKEGVFHQILPFAYLLEAAGGRAWDSEFLLSNIWEWDKIMLHGPASASPSLLRLSLTCSRERHH